MVKTLLRLLKPLASLRLTVVLLTAAMLLVFFGTLAQRTAGIWTVQKQYFHALIIWGLGPPLPGGFTIAGLLLINLIAAHAVRFSFAWKRAGIILIHGGIILLLVGEIITGLFALETQMAIPTGQTVNYTFDVRRTELALIDTSGPEHDRVVALPQTMLREGAAISDPNLPFEVLVERYFINANLVGPMQQGPNILRLGDREVGATLGLVELRDETDPERVNMPAAFITLRRGSERLGTWLLSTFLGPQSVEFDGKTYLIALRNERHYKPYGLHLIKFTHEKYPGTEIPKEFSSRVRLTDPRHSEDREALIFMNAPLRYDGKTFYQSGFADNDTTTILQVVDNPAVWLPYVSCVLVGLGMTVHFLLMLGKYLARKAA